MGNIFQSDNSSRGGIGSSPARGRGGRGRGGVFDRGGSNIGQDNFCGISDPCNRGSGGFGGTYLPQEQNVGGFRDQKSGLGASGDFGGCGISQQDHGTKSGGSETSGNFGDHIVSQ